MSPPLTIRLFGPMQVLVHDRPLPPLRSRKAAWLLALLALRWDRPVLREWLAGTLWPDVDQSRAAANLRVVLSELRRALGDQGRRLQSPDRHTLCLDLAGADVDVPAFDTAISNTRPPALGEAVSLYRGPLLEGCTEEWVGQERLVREQHCLQALRTLAETALHTHDAATAAGHYRRIIGMDPWSEFAQRGLMEALARAGDINAALQTYREFARLLRGEAMAVPDEATTALYTRLRAKAREGVPGAQGAPVAAAVGTARTVTGYLPHPLTGLVGREDERLEVTTRLRRSRLVTLTGPGGIGKTRLALAVAAEAAPDYPDGVWLVGLEALSGEDQVAGQVVGVLGLKEEPGRPPLEVLAGHLRDKRFLLVLDNCEHLLGASARVAGHLLRECAGGRVLATSREALRITGEAAWAVPPLAVPVPEHLPAGQATLLRVLMGYEGVQLFVERARAAQKSFALTGGNARVVAQVCARLEGIPLALELAAARVRALTVAQVAARLDDRLGLLTAGGHAAPSRQQTLRATLDWSYDLLGEAERALLGRLSVFAGGWGLETAEAVCAGAGQHAGEVLDLLASLVDKSLVVFEEAEARDGVREGRYRLLETMRQYAAERLERRGETGRVRAGHRDHFLALVEAADPLLTGADQGRHLARLEVEHENLRAALAWCAAEEGGAAAGLRLAGALWRFWMLRGHYGEGRASLAWALGRPGAEGATLARAKALKAAGVLAFYQGDHGAARAPHEEGLAIFRALGDQEGVAWSIHDLGRLSGAQGDLAAARALHEESLATFREIGHRRGIGLSLHHMGSIARDRGDLTAAWTLHEQSLAILRELSDRQGIAWSLHHLGGVAGARGDLAAARALHEESLATFQEIGHQRGVAWALHQLGSLAYDQGGHQEARTLHEQSLAILRALSDRQGIARSLNYLGSIACDRGEYAAARALHEESLAISRDLGYPRGVAWALHHLGSLAYDHGDHGEAKALHEESLENLRALSDRQGAAWSLNALGRLAGARGDLAAARALHEESLATFREMNNPSGVGRSLISLGGVAADQGQPAAAVALYQEGLDSLGRVGDRRGVAVGLRGLAAAVAPWEPEQAARLWGMEQSLRESLDALLPPPERAVYDRRVAEARAASSHDVFATAWASGRALTWEASVAFALEEIQAARVADSSEQRTVEKHRASACHPDQC